MLSLITDAKREVVSFINAQGKIGASESDVFRVLYDFNQKNGIFGYGNDTTPKSLVENLIIRGIIVRHCQEGLVECRYYMAPVLELAEQ